jgi:hypothetical protein
MAVGSLSERLALIIDANVDSAVSGLRKVGDTAEKELGKSQGHLDQLGGKLQTAGVGMMAFGATALAGFGEMAKAGEEAHQVDLKLENSVTNAGDAAGGSVKPFVDLAQAMQNKTKFDDEAVKSAEAFGIQVGLTKDQVLGVTPLVADLAAKTGMDLTSAMQVVTKAMEGKKKGLENLVGPLDATTYASDRYKAITDALSHSVGGFAETQGKSFSGQLEIMKNKMHDLEEGVGVGAVNAFENMFRGVTAVTGALDKLSPGTQAGIGEWGTYAATGLIAVGALNLVAGTVIKARDNFASLTEMLGFHRGAAEADAVATELDGDALVGDAAKTEADVVAKGELVAANEEAAVSMVPVVGGILALGAATVYGIQHAQEYSFNIKQLADATSGSNEEVKKASIVMSAAAGSAENFGKQAAEQSIPQAIAFADKMDRAGVSSEGFRKGIQGTIDAQRQSNVDQKQAQDVIDGTADAYGNAADKAIDFADAAKRVDDQLHASMDPLFGMVNAMHQNRDAQTAAKDAVDKYGASSKEATDANYKAAESAMGVHDASIKLEGAVRSGKVSVDGATQSLNQWVWQGLLTKQQADEVSYSFAVAGGKADELDGKNVQIHVDATGLEYANSLAHDLYVSLDNDAGKAALVKEFAPGSFGGNAAGTDDWRGGLSWVGETGRELISLPRGAAVINNRNAEALARTGARGGPSVVENHFHFHVAGSLIGEERELRRILDRADKIGIS